MIGTWTGSARDFQGFDEALRSAVDLLASDPSAALELASALAAKQPDPRAFRVAAAACQALDRHEAAAEAELKGIKFGFTPPLRTAVAAQQAGQSQHSKALADEYLRVCPDDLLAMTIAAEAAIALRQTETAEAHLRRVRERAPAFPRAGILLANLLSSQLKLREAIGICEDLVRRNPDDQVALRYLADLCGQAGDYSVAAKHYATIISSGPESSSDLVKYAQNLRATGRKSESVDALRRAIDLSPGSGAAWWALAHYFPEELSAGNCNQIEGALAHAGPSANDAGLLRIALSIIYDRQGLHEAAFRQISAVKAEHPPHPPYNPEILSKDVDQLIGGFTPNQFSQRGLGRTRSETPIFVVGMPRSGSTLVERILGCHSKIEAAGELQVLPRLIADDDGSFTEGRNSLLPQTLSREKLAEMAECYLDRTRQFRRTGKPFFIDKHNGSWIHAGVIRLMFPAAKILDVRRGAVDCCWSVFKMMFGDAYANDQRHLARYFRDYVRFMEAIDTAAPGGILLVSYESLVDDVEREARRILSFVGVDYEPQCAEFQSSNEPVATPSSEQVRRPLFREGIGSAEPYRKWLGPLIEELTASLPQIGARKV